MGGQGLMRSYTRLAAALAVAHSLFCTSVLAAGPEVTREVVEQAYDRGEYRSAAVNGARLLAQNKESAEQQANLRFKVANSLAWTGRYDAAIVQYEKLFGSSLDADARIGIASIMRWRGMPDVAHVYLQQAQAKATQSTQLQQAQAQLDRDLRPALNVKLSDTADNSQFGRRDLTLGLRYWSNDRKFRTDVGAIAGDDRYLGSNTPFRSLSLGAMAAAWWGAPKLSAAVHQADKTRVFGSLEVEPLRSSAPELLVLRAASVDYGRLAFNARAPLLGLRATNLGVRSRIESPIGNLAARADMYRVSDNNRLIDADLKFTSAWQPLPFGVLVDLGLSARKAEVTSANYWSPSRLYALGTVGVRKAWYWDDAEISLGMQQGFKLSDEARNNLSLSASGKLWLDQDNAIGLEASWSKSPRPNDYRTRYVGVSLQHNF
jgi:hypothetical protein